MEEALEMARAKDTKKRKAAVERLHELLEASRKSLSPAEVTPLVDCCLDLLKDSDFRVSQRALQALASAAVLAGEHLKLHLNALVPAVVERLGDSKQSVREAARRLLKTLMEVSSPTIIIERASSNAWNHKNWRVRKGFARTVTSAIGLSASTELPLQRVILAPILKMLNDREQAVKEAANLCIEEMYRQGWSQFREELQRHNLPSHVVNDINARLERIEPQQRSTDGGCSGHHVDNEVETSSVNPDPRPKKRKSKGENVEKSKKRKVSKSEDTQKAVNDINARLERIEPQQRSTDGGCSGHHVDNEVETSSVNPKSKGENVEKSKNPKVSKSEDTRKAVEREFDTLMTTETCEESKNLSRSAVSFISKSPVMRIDGCDVFRATRDARNVAAKRSPITTSALQNAKKEMKLNYMAENVSDFILICYGMEFDDKYIYLFFQPWQCTLGELVRFCSRRGSKEDCLCKEFLVKFEKNNSLWLEDDGPSDLLKDILKDVIGGVSDLHKSCIIHAKINVDNICIVSKGHSFKAKITGFGSAMDMGLENLQLKNRMVDDVVALGCVLGFSLAHGNSLHNDVDGRSCNEGAKKINKGAKKILKKSPDAYELVQDLTKPHGHCCTAIEALAHPFFWPPAKKISFIQVSSERFMSARADPKFVHQVKKSGHKVMKTNWLAAIDEDLKNELCKPGSLVHYHSGSLFDLIRCIRNQLEHYKEVQKNITLKNLIGDSQESMLRYFTSRFPNLLLEMHQIVSRHFKEEPEFKCYFPTD